MANKKWTGATSTDWNTAGNWVSSGVPSASDVCYLTDSAQAIAAYDNTAVALNGIVVGPGMTGNIGSGSGNELQLDTNYVKFAGLMTQAWFDLENGGAAVEVYVDRTKATSNMETEGLHLGSSSTDPMNPLVVTGGYVTVEDSAYVGDVHVLEGPNSSGLTMKLGESLTVSGSSTMNVMTGTVELNSGGWATLNVGGGTVTLLGAGNLTTVNVYGSGTVYFKGSGTLTTVNIYRGGTFNAEETVDTPGTVTNTNIYGGTLRARSPQNHPTFTNAPLVYSPSATVSLPTGTTATLAYAT